MRFPRLRFPRICLPSQRVVAYVIVSAAFFLSIFSLHAQLNADRSVTERATRITCQEVNKVKQKLIGVINRSAGPTPIPPNADPALRAVIEQSNLDRQAYQKQALADFSLTNCRQLVKDPPPTTTSTTEVGTI